MKGVRVSLASVLIVLFVSNKTIAQDSAASAPALVEKRFENEIRVLADASAVKEAFKIIMELEPQTHQDLITINEIPAPPFKEQERAAKYLRMLQEAGIDSVWIDKVGNVIGRRKGRSGKKTIVLEAHLDTVFPEGTDVKVKFSGDTLRAPGIGDDSRGLAMVLAVARAMVKAKIQTDADVLFIGTVGEEGLGDLRGVKHLFSGEGPKIDSYIAVDGGSIGSISHRALGSHRYRVTFKGPGGHSSGAFGIANPHNALGRAITYFATEANGFIKQGIRTTYNVGVVGGGTSVNSIPFESWMEVDMRSESPERLNGVDKIFQAAVQRALKEENLMKSRGADLSVDVKLVGDRPSGGIDARAPLVQRTIAMAKYLNAVPRLGVSSTNSNIPFSKNVPSVTIGRGGVGGGAHALDEWWVNDKGHLAIQGALLLVLAEAGMVK